MIKLQAVQIKPDIYWVGGIDWDLRNFHGYHTPRGTSYNAYLIIDKKITLIDTVKHYMFDEMLSRIESVINPKKIDTIISNHVEMDHSGSLSKILKYSPKAQIYTSTKGEKGLQRHYKKSWNLNVLKSGDTLNIGKRTLHFQHIPMVHWPDSMVTYSPTDKLLIPNDAFGQHIACSNRFDDEIGWNIVKEEAAKYYANIVLPYGDQVQKALQITKTLDIDMIAPSHGIIWRSYLKEIIDEYEKWSTHQTEPKALIIYDTMWGSTKTIAYTFLNELEKLGIPTTIRNLSNSHISDVITDLLTTRLIILGSPTLNNTMLPTMGGFLTYLKGLRPKNRIGFVFGSYGWSGQAVGEIEKVLTDLKWELPEQSINLNFIPDEAELKELKKIATNLAQHINKRG